MDEYLFSTHLVKLRALPEPMTCLEMLNYPVRLLLKKGLHLTD